MKGAENKNVKLQECVTVCVPWRAGWQAGDDSLELCVCHEMSQPEERQVAAHIGSSQISVSVCVCADFMCTFDLKAGGDLPRLEG